MKNWTIAFAVAILVVIGYAAGPIGVMVAIASFAVALFLLWSEKLGFSGAKKQLGLNDVFSPTWTAENWERLEAVLADRETFDKACTIAVGVIGTFLVLPTTWAATAIAIVLAFFVFEISKKAPKTASTVLAASPKTPVTNGRTTLSSPDDHPDRLQDN
jgi:hypothetical protein